MMSPSRRSFLKASLGATALVSLGSVRSQRLQAAADRGATENSILVVVELAGGNDGLNTVVPYENDVYGRSRPTLRLTGKEVLRINDQLGFHPQLQGFQRLYQEGNLTIVQGVGYPNPNGDHDAAMLDWQSAQPHATNRQTGWVGRAIDTCDHSDSVSVPAALIGQTTQPFCLTAKRTIVPTINSLEGFTLRSANDPQGQSDDRDCLRDAAQLARAQSNNPLLKTVQQGQRAAYASSQRIEALLRTASASAGDYPRFHLARQLQTIAQLIRAESGIRIFFTGFGGDGIGGFDNHANQRDNHAALLRHLSESVAAFSDDLQRHKLLDRVVLMTFSEFGRTVQENGRKGTGHGSAAPLLLVGGKLKGGLVGEHPSLTKLESGGPEHHTDFRRVYATVLQSWLGFDSQAALGDGFAPLDVFET